MAGAVRAGHLFSHAACLQIIRHTKTPRTLYFQALA